jgi:hypothetical protein
VKQIEAAKPTVLVINMINPWVINEVEPGGVIAPHYHECEQFMVVLAGGGTLAGDPLTPGTLQYTEPRTPYGPIVAGDDGLTFIVIRPHFTQDDKGVPISDTIERIRAAQART